MARERARTVTMALCINKTHCPDRQMLERIENAIMLGVIGTGLAACAFGAIIYDVGRLFSAW
jgi:hypothetical protein